MAVTYEWDVEELEAPDTGDNDPDILDHHFCDTYADAVRIAAEYPARRIVLVRNVGNDTEGLTDRAWAYVSGGKLPATFTYAADEDSGIAVPVRFHKEVAA